MRRVPTLGASRGRGALLLVLVALAAVGLVLVLAPPADTPAGPRPPGTTPSATPTPRAPSPSAIVPTLLVGAAMHDNGDPAALEAEAGARLGVRRTFWDSRNVGESVAVAAQDVALGRVPLLSYKVGDWTAAADGAMDAWARDAAAGLGALDGLVLVAVHHEPEGDGDITEWTRMQQRLAPIFHREGVRFGVVVTGYHQVYGTADYALDALWPTGAPVSFLGIDVYQLYGTVDDETGEVNPRWTDLEASYFEEVGRFAAERGVAWGVAETGITDEAWAEYPEARTWFADTAREVAAHGGAFFAYFNTAQNSGANTWPLAGDKRRAFTELLQDPPPAPVGLGRLTRP